MRKKLLYSLCLLGALIGLTPFVDGYLFKQIYMQRILTYQDLLQNNNNVKVEVSDYDLGWLQSTAQLTITFQATYKKSPIYQLPPFVFHVESRIHHGPIVWDEVNNSYSIAYATITSSLTLPDLLKAFASNPGIHFMQVFSLISLDGRTWNNHYQIPAVTFMGDKQWEGLAGDMVLFMSPEGAPIRMHGTTTIGGITAPFDAKQPTLPEISVSAISYSVDASKEQTAIWSGSSTITSTGLSAKWQDGRTLGASNFTMNSSYGANPTDANAYSYTYLATLDSMQIPAPSPVKSVSNLKQTLSLNNLDIAGVDHYLTSLRTNKFSNENSEDQFQAALKMMTPTSSLHTTLVMNTNLGPGMVNLAVSLHALPKAKTDVIPNVNVDFNARAAASLVEGVLASYYAQTTPPAALSPPPVLAAQNDPVAKSNAMIATWMQQGFIVNSNNEYLISLTKKNNIVTLNGKDVSASFDALIQPLQQSLAYSTNAANANSVLASIQAIITASYTLSESSGSFATANIADTTLIPLLPAGALATPWGEMITISAVTQDSYNLTIPKVPPVICLLIRSKLDSVLTTNSPACSPSEPTNLTYTVKAKPVQ